MPDSHQSKPPFLPSSNPTTHARLLALYAFSSSQRTSNPTGYGANVAWWSSIIEAGLISGWVNGAGTSAVAGHSDEGEDEDDSAEGSKSASRHVDRLWFRLDESLIGRFEWDGRRPKGLAGVVETQSSTNPPTLYPLPTYLTSPTPLLAPPALVNRLVTKPLWWALSQLNPFGSSEGKEVSEDQVWKVVGKGKEWVHMGLVQQSASKFRSHIIDNPPTSYSESIHDLASFHATYGRTCMPSRGKSLVNSPDEALSETRKGKGKAAPSLSLRDVELLVKWLMRDEGVVVSDGTVVKVLDPGEVASEHTITEVDRGVISVLNALKKVEGQIERVEGQIAQCQVKARSYLSSGQRNVAMSQLRTKKALEEVLEKRSGVVEQLRGVIRGIDQASSDAEVMAAYETSNTTLRALLANPLLDADRVEKTTTQLADTLADQKEIDDAIRIGGQVAIGAGGVEGGDDDELAKELEELIQEEKNAAAAAAAEDEKKKAEEENRANREKEQQAPSSSVPNAAGPNPSKAEREQGRGVFTASSTSESIAVTDKMVDRPKEAESVVVKGSDAKAAAAAEAEAEAEAKAKAEAQKEWERRYEESRAREKAEKERAERERLQREERRVLAE